MNGSFHPLSKKVILFVLLMLGVLSFFVFLNSTTMLSQLMLSSSLSSSDRNSENTFDQSLCKPCDCPTVPQSTETNSPVRNSNLPMTTSDREREATMRKERREEMKKNPPYPSYGKIYTYYDYLPGFRDDRALVQEWKRTWTNHGWEPIVLTKEVAMKHPQYSQLISKFEALPTVNPKEYEMSCYLRYFAMSYVGGGWMTDYDIVNLRFYPDEYLPVPKVFTTFQGYNPALSFGTQQEFDRILKLMSEYKLKSTDIYWNKPHISDMYIMKYLGEEKKIDHVENGPVERGLLIHLGTQMVYHLQQNLGINLDKILLSKLSQVIISADSEHAAKWDAQ